MGTKTEIANLALGYAKQDATISSFTEDSTHARRVRRFYNQERRMLLQMFPWPFASQVVSLPEKDVESDAGYSFVFKYPDQALNIRPVTNIASLVQEDTQRKWYEVFLASDLSGREIHTNINPFTVKITYDVENENLFDALFSDLLAASIAVKIAPLYNLDTKDFNLVLQQYALIKREAEKYGANLDNVPFDEENGYVEARDG